MPEIETEAPAIFRGMLRDLIACDSFDEISDAFGLVPAGPDVDRVEHAMSHARIEEFMPIAEDTLTHADVAADVLFQLTHMEEEDEDDDGLAMFHFISRTASCAVISHLLENGVLAVGETA